MKPKMLLLTSTFPYGKGEKTFIIPELQLLLQEYDITLITHARDLEREDTQNKSRLDGRVQLFHINNGISLPRMLCWGISYFLDRESLQDLWQILRDGKFLIKRMHQSIVFYILSKREVYYIEKAKLLNSDDEIVCYSFWYTYYCYAFLRLKKKYPNLKVITRTHGVDLYDERIPGRRQPFRKIMDKQLNGVIFAAQYAKGYYLEQVSAKSDDVKYAVCKLGVEKGERKEKNSKVFCMLSCSFLVPLKRVELIIRALSLLEDEIVHWIHIGDGECYEETIEYAKEQLSGHKNISYELMGYLNSAQIRKIYEENKIDCFITTSATEGGCPVSIQEAMAYSIPIIGTAVGGITEMIEGNGILLSSNPTCVEIVKAIKKIYHMGEIERDYMGRKSYDIWKRDYNCGVNAKKLVETIHCLEGK